VNVQVIWHKTVWNLCCWTYKSFGIRQCVVWRVVGVYKDSSTCLWGQAIQKTGRHCNSTTSGTARWRTQCHFTVKSKCPTKNHLEKPKVTTHDIFLQLTLYWDVKLTTHPHLPSCTQTISPLHLLQYHTLQIKGARTAVGIMTRTWAGQSRFQC